MAYLSSKQVQVYPSAYRGQTQNQELYNPESRLPTEYNLTNAIKSLTSLDGYIISPSAGSSYSADDSIPLEFNLHGYNFKLVDFTIDDLSLSVQDGDIIYAHITTTNKNPNYDPLTNTDYPATSLASLEDTEGELDISENSGSIFTGLEFVTSIPEGASGYFLPLFEFDSSDSTYGTIKTSYIKLDSSNIRDTKTTDYRVTIDDRFTTSELVTNVIAPTSLLNITNNSYVDGTLHTTGAITSSGEIRSYTALKALAANGTTWRPIEGGSITAHGDISTSALSQSVKSNIIQPYNANNDFVIKRDNNNKLVFNANQLSLQSATQTDISIESGGYLDLEFTDAFRIMGYNNRYNLQFLESGLFYLKDVGGSVIETTAAGPDSSNIIISASEGDIEFYAGQNDKVLTIYSEAQPGVTFYGILANGDNSFNVASSGNVSAKAITGTVITATSYFNATSDKRLKENIEKYECSKSILDLPVYRFDFIDGDKNQIGCLAQDLQTICPEIVHENKDGYLSIQESKLVYLLIEEVKKLKEEMESLKK